MNGRPVFNMTHDDCCREIKSSGQALRIELERGENSWFLERCKSGTDSLGDHIVPSFEEILGLRGDDSCDGSKRKKHIGMEYYQATSSSH